MPRSFPVAIALIHKRNDTLTQLVSAALQQNFELRIAAEEEAPRTQGLARWIDTIAGRYGARWRPTTASRRTS